MAAENKTRPTGAAVTAFLDAVPDETRRADAHELAATMERLSGDPPAMWGPSIVGFGACHYRYESGREGDMPRIGFSPRAKELVLYLSDSFDGYAELMARLGKHRTGKSCLYIKRLADIDRGALDELISSSLASVDRRYPGGASASADAA